MNKIFKHKRGASGLKVVCEFAKSHCSSGEKTAVNSGAHVSTRSGFKSLSIALISALTLGIATPAMAVVFGEAGNKGGATANGAGSTAGGYNAKALGNSSTAIGMNAESSAGQTLAVGIFARAKGDQSTAIGNDVVSLGASSIAIGNDDISSVYKNNPLFTAEELTKKDIVDELDKLCAIANCQSMYGLKKVGSVYVTVEDDIVNNAPKYRQWSPTFTTGAGAIAIGSRTVAMSDGATAIGTLAVAAGKKSAALGSFSKATAENALAFGAESIASGINSSVFGIGAKASKNNSMAIGTGAVSNIENSIALGVNSKTDYTGSDKRGYMPGNGYMLPMASSAGVISVGSATQPRRIVNLASGALDTDAVNVAQLKSLAENLGVDDIADNTDKTMRYLSVNRLTGSAAAGVQDLIQKEKDFKTYSQYRKYHDIMVLGKNRTGTTDYDNEINELATKISNMEGKYNGFHDAITTPAGLATINQNSSEQDVQNVTNSINGYTTTILTAAEKTTIKSHNAANEGATGADAIAIGYDAKSTGAQAVSLGKTATASGADAIAIGNGATAVGEKSIVIGKGTKANSYSTINIGEGVAASLSDNTNLIGFGNKIGNKKADITVNNTTILGNKNEIDGKEIKFSTIIGTFNYLGDQNKESEFGQNVVIGDHIQVNNSKEATTIGNNISALNSKGGIAIGGDDIGITDKYQTVEIEGKGAMAIGSGSRAKADAAMSLGVFSNTTVIDGVALGSNSAADRASIVNKTDAYNGSDTNVANTIKGSYGAVSVGNSDATRQIINVAAGSADTDAVNVAQLKNNGFNVKGKDSAGADKTNLIKSGKTVEFASADKYLKISHTATTGGDSKFTFDVDENELKKTIGATSTGNYSLEFIGDTGANITRDQTNKELKIKGGATTELSTNNIGVETSGGDTLNIKLAKVLKGLTSAEFTNAAGDTTTITGDKITINPNGNTNHDKEVSLNKDGLNNGGNKITNIADGEDPTDAVSKQQAKNIANQAAKDFAKDKLKAGTNVTITPDTTTGEVTISATDNDTKTKVVEGSGIKVTGGNESGDTKTYTVSLDQSTKDKLASIDTISSTVNNAMQNFKVAADGTEATIAGGETLNFAADNNLEVKLSGKTVTYKMKDGVQFNDITAGKKGSDGTDGKVGVNGKDGSGVAIDGKDGKIVAHGENGENGKSVVINGKDGTIGAKGADGKDGVVINGDEHTIIAKGENGKDGVTINGKDGSIGLPGKDGTSANGVVIKSGDVVNGVDGTNGITRIVYTDKNGDHQVATLDDGIKFVGNNGDKALKLNKQFTIQGADANKDTGTATTVWNKFDAGANIMTKAEADGTENGRLTIALAKALKGLTSAEFSDSVKIGGATISGGTDNSLSFGNAKITNIAAGENDKDAVNKQQAKTIAQDEAKKAIDPTFLKNKIKAGTNIASIATEGTGDDAKLKINANGAKVEGVTDGFVTVTSSSETGNITKYTVDLKDDIKTKINDAANATANATSAMQSLNVKVGTDNAELNKNNNTLEFAAGNNLKVELDQANRKVTYKLADNLKFDNINAGKKGSDGTDGKVGVNGKDGSGVAIDGKDGKIVAHGENGENGKSVVINGKDGTIGAKGADGKDGVVINGDEHTIIAKGENGKDGVTINGKDGSIGLPGKDGTSANGVVIKSGDVVNGVDGTNGITRIVYTDKNGDHQVATLDDGIKFVGNNGDKALKLNKQFTIQGADANKDTGTATTVWNKFDAGANIMTKAEADGTENGRLTIALAKALKGLTSAEFVGGGTDGGKTVINGDGVSYNKADNLDTDGSVKDPNKTVSIGKDGINAGGKTISNVGEAQNANDAVNMKQMNETIKTAIAKNNANTELTFVGDVGETKAKDGKITIAGGQTKADKLSDQPNIGVVAKDGKLNIKLAKDIEVESVTAKDKITVGEGANKITIADGKITGITSAVDPNGNLAKTLADIGKDTSITDADKATKKKEAIQKALDSVVDNGSVATVGDLKNVTKGLDSVVSNVVTNVTNVTTNVNNITNVVTGGDSNIINKINNAKDAKKADSNYKDVVKDNPLKTYNPYDKTVKNNTSVVEAIKNINERGIKFIHVSDSDKVGKDDDVKLGSEDSQANKKGSIGIGMNAMSDGTDAIATGTDSKASGKNSIATGTNSIATGTNSIAMGTDAQAMGENTISIGTGNKVIGKKSGAIGDPTTMENVNGVYSMGNDNFIQGSKDRDVESTAKHIFAIGNNIGSKDNPITQAANGSVILGSKGYSNVENGVALGYGSNVDRGALTDKKSAYNGEDKGVRDTIRGDYGAVSVGNEGATRQIINVAAGRDDSDAVNVAQLKAATSKIMASTNGISMSGVTIDPKTGKQVNFIDVNKPTVTNTGVNSVAIGANSVANRANTVSVGSAGNERIIANVADGVAPTDAANMRQLQSVANMVGEVKKDAMAGTASAMAIGNLPQATIPGKGMMAIGAGYYKGQTATALGVSKMSENGRWVFKASASYDSQRNVGAAGAVGFHF